MKTNFFILLMLFSFSAFSQKKSKAEELKLDTIPKVDGKYEYVEIVSVSNESAENLFKRAKLYFVDTYKSANDVIQYEDKETFKIVGKGYFELSDFQTIFVTVSSHTFKVFYSTEITSKQGKYRYRFYDIRIKQTSQVDREIPMVFDTDLESLKNGSEKGALKKMYTRVFNKISDNFRASQASLIKYMSGQDKSKDDF